MRFKFLSLIAAAALVSACQTAPDEKAGATGGGSAPAAASGAAGAPTKGSQEDLTISAGDRVHFDFDKFNLDAGDKATLDKQAAWLKKNAAVSITVEGHCDERGTREYNLALGERRANSVKDHLVAAGVGVARIKMISYGKERPVAVGSNEEAWAQNRRAVTKVNTPGG
ncbi:MAG: peptidoglycan-associated lipoprotein [Rhodospirillales bacterium RIFCSPLOWO2_12_FULL_58_28]|nr:MAG: peptidoglycan-associated lipoprotein [Rhodospirillales bacterium RIFCSPLOWO2_02_FULL_58_16]OHC78529.1 MAG: peptidoglycan-associated lipoprotein [Rhodospirillales bacterium RIFCSPLOWO2_12_FULL_58_28]